MKKKIYFLVILFITGTMSMQAQFQLPPATTVKQFKSGLSKCALPVKPEFKTFIDHLNAQWFHGIDITIKYIVVDASGVWRSPDLNLIANTVSLGNVSGCSTLVLDSVDFAKSEGKYTVANKFDISIDYRLSQISLKNTVINRNFQLTSLGNGVFRGERTIDKKNEIIVLILTKGSFNLF